ncbi:MAG: ATP-binding protein [Candidatus Eisenbacteria bacterium]
MIRRFREAGALLRRLRTTPVVAIIGPRQVGKTTLARQVASEARGTSHYFDLEDPRDLRRLEHPMVALEGLRGLIVIDEVQRRPDLFPILRVLSDRPRRPSRFLILGSASPDLLRQTTESLAGRVAYHELRGLDLAEVGAARWKALWLRGGLPRSYLARALSDSIEWREQFVRTYLERDLPQLGIQVSADTLRRFWTMLAHYHGQTWNASELGRAFGVSDATVRRYLDILSSTLVVRQLSPWHENLSKRQVKAPKVYVSDSGLLHRLLGVDDAVDLERHPKVGASWEGFALEQVVAQLGARRSECYYWRTHTGAELDLLVVRGRRRYGFEFKRADAPTLTPSMRSAMDDLRLDSLDVIYPGVDVYTLAKKVRAVPLTVAVDTLKPLP